MLTYIDSSVALRSILAQDSNAPLEAWIDHVYQSGGLLSSQLLRTEVIRTLRRDSRPVSDGQALLTRVRLVRVTDATFTVAESIERHIKTLDALHLATALLIGEPITVASHDSTMLSVAEHLGLDTIDPINSA